MVGKITAQISSVLFSLLIITVLPLSAMAQVPDSPETQTETPTPENSETHNTILISELQTGGLGLSSEEDGKFEFVELYVQSDVDVDMTGWKLEYFASSREDVNVKSSIPTRTVYEFDGTGQARGYILLSYEGYLTEADVYFGAGSTLSSGLLAKSGGHIRLIDSEDNILDTLGWGSAKQPETKAVAVIPAGSSAIRDQAIDEEVTGPVGHEEGLEILEQVNLVDTDDNFSDFEITMDTTPTGGGYTVNEHTEEEPEEENSPVDEVIEETAPAEDEELLKVEVTELLPNPGQGKLDSEDEFIELHNPNDFTIDLAGYALKTASSSKTYEYILPETILEPGEYRAIYSKDSGLALVNTTGYSWIEAPDGGVLDETYWYEDVGEDEAWAILDSWQTTNVPTPNAANKPSVVQEVLSESDENEKDSFVPCAEGKFRNPETNRCKNIESTTSTLVPCTAGQQRNPETNRCRNVISAASSMLKPCDPGQERNPDTNRCRKIVTALSTLKACQEGYERNPDTNRCRKVSTSPAANLASTSDDAAENVSKPNYLLLGLVSVGALGYGLFEYRGDIGSFIARIRSKATQSK